MKGATMSKCEMSIRQLCQKLGLTKQRISVLISQGRIKYRKIDTFTVITDDEILPPQQKEQSK
tara:strand:- start:5630 stop:5818 length:189 start_codon:yes stop_codon:yes gene_type:complete